MDFFRKKTNETKKAKSADEPKLNHEATHVRIVTAEGWHRKVLGKSTEVVPKKRG